ncbi:very short patch repair protein [mine drainage metagenome]|uniref:Very short patch repair protein n=1 Tax=mine drainage metagenome TaxID=410659 RepID=A0A1J5S7M8_9ZZZZ
MAGYERVTPATRTRMQAVRRQDTEPEIFVRRMLHGMGYRFRLHRKDLPGTPDIVLPKLKKAVLVHGCFWHGHENCRRAILPKSNAVTWAAKIENNKARDLKQTVALRKLGWDVMVVWECEVKNAAEETRSRLCTFLST